ncbi:hypothetical protein ACWDUD_21735 [Rhodococcus sp. NPDC003382]
MGGLDAEPGAIGIDILASRPCSTPHTSKDPSVTARLLSSIAAALVGVVAFCGCSTDPGSPATVPASTSAETSPPAHSSLELPASTIPSAEQVTEMLAAAFDYDLDLNTRVRLFEGATVETPDPVQQVAHTGEATLRAISVVPDGVQALVVSVVGTGASRRRCAGHHRRARRRRRRPARGRARDLEDQQSLDLHRVRAALSVAPHR